ncbi:autotransporter domain-containing protein [Bradyrhizobium sp. AZCC 1693]|uniref:autotransporter domain-containing protein n=1 Tax=Bradyrhizobium sp. AZCC 1693 TaxID=3117029 RepID=UPI002FEFBEF6
MAYQEQPMARTRQKLHSAGRLSLAALLGTAASCVVPAHAVDATWLGNNAGNPTEWVEPLNWSGGALPDGTATFTNTGQSVVDANGIVTIGTIQFTAAPDAQAYTITNNDTFIVNGAGVINNSTNPQTFNVNASMSFQNSATASGGTLAVTYINASATSFNDTSTAGSAIVTNNGVLEFNTGSTAGSAAITNNAVVNFYDATSGGSANITNLVSGTVSFNGTATANTATIVNDGLVQFTNSSTAGSANITNNNLAALSFGDTSTAGTSTIANFGDIVFNNASKGGSSNITNTGGSLSFNDTSTAELATITNNIGGLTTFNNTSTAGTANITNNFGSTSFLDTSTAANATILNTGPSSTFFTGNSSAGSANITNIDAGTFSAATLFFGAATAATSTITNNIGGSTVFGNSNGADTATAGSAQITNNAGGQTQFLAATTAGNSVITNNAGGFLEFGTSGGGTDTATAGNANITNNGTTTFNASTTGGNAVITTNNGGNVFFLNNSTGGNAQFVTNTGGTFDMSGLGSAGTAAGSIAGAGSYILGAKNLAAGGNNLSTTVSGMISGAGGALTKVGTGALTLTNTNTYTGATIVNGGTLVADGSIAASALTTVNAGGTLSGSGIVGNTAIAGGTLAPGSAGGSIFGPLTVQGNLSFTAASTYMIQVSPANAGRTNVTGMATLGGATVNAVFSPANYVQTQYTILNATGNVSGTFNPTVNSNLANIQSTLSYDANNVYLTVKLGYTPPPGGFSVNQQNVANTLTNYFSSTGSIPAAFAALNAGGLIVASGELGTGIIQSAINADNLFLNMLLDPTIAGRSGGFVPVGSASPYAAEDEASAYTAKRLATPTERAAYAMATKAPLLSAQPLNRWSVWGAAYGGSATTGGNAMVGSQDLSARVWGVVGGADYKVTPNTLLGFALAGGGTNYSLANALGRGSSDLFQAGIFGRHNFGPAYLSAALAYGWHDVTTNRTVTLAGFDQLQARFKAETFSGRFEGGYRFATPFAGITPYAAAQVISFNLPAYAEQAIVGTPLFALNYASQTTTATRTELGLRTDKSIAMQGAMLTLCGRLAWAHDYNPDLAVTALFQALAGTSFVVNGARGNPDAALVSAGAEMKWLNGLSLAGTFEGEFSGNTTSYAGKGVAKYSW